VKLSLCNKKVYTLVSGHELVIGFKIYKLGQNCVSKDKGKLNVGKRLLRVMRSHTNFIDIVVYEALFCNSI